MSAYNVASIQTLPVHRWRDARMVRMPCYGTAITRALISNEFDT